MCRPVHSLQFCVSLAVLLARTKWPFFRSQWHYRYLLEYLALNRIELNWIELNWIEYSPRTNSSNESLTNHVLKREILLDVPPCDLDVTLPWLDVMTHWLDVIPSGVVTMTCRRIDPYRRFEELSFFIFTIKQSKKLDPEDELTTLYRNVDN